MDARQAVAIIALVAALAAYGGSFYLVAWGLICALSAFIMWW